MTKEKEALERIALICSKHFDTESYLYALSRLSEIDRIAGIALGTRRRAKPRSEGKRPKAGKEKKRG